MTPHKLLDGFTTEYVPYSSSSVQQADSPNQTQIYDGLQDFEDSGKWRYLYTFLPDIPDMRHSAIGDRWYTAEVLHSTCFFKVQGIGMAARTRMNRALVCGRCACVCVLVLLGRCGPVRPRTAVKRNGERWIVQLSLWLILSGSKAFEGCCNTSRHVVKEMRQANRNLTCQPCRDTS